MFTYSYCAQALRPSLRARIPSGAAFLAILLFQITSIAAQVPSAGAGNAAALTAASPLPIVTSEGRTETVRVPMIAEPWSATALHRIPPQRNVAHFVGRFPGYEASKRQANQRAHASAPPRVLAQEPSSLITNATPSSSVIFEGPNESDTKFVPPNPNIAAGPKYLVVLINSLIAIYDKSGNQQGGFTDLPTFFSSLGVTGDVYDPRVIFDPNDNRFIMSFTNVDLTNPTFGNILIAVSQTSDPTGNWYKFMLDSKGLNNSNHLATFPDFPTLGLSTSAVYISDGQFELNRTCLNFGGCSFSDTWVRVISLPELLAGNPSLNITTFTGVTTADGAPGFSLEAAVTAGFSSEEFLVGADFSSNPGNLLNVYSINTTGVPKLSTANLTVPSYAIPPSAYAATGDIETGDFRTLNAVAGNGTLWTAQNSAGQSGYAAAEWYAISIPSLAGLALSQSGSITGSMEAYFPAVAAKPNGDVIVSFTTSSMTENASAAFTGRAASDAAGAMRGYAIYREGTDGYMDFAFRWGDYNGAAVDPSGNSVWTIVEYAGSPDPHFGTAIAQVAGPPLFTFSEQTLGFGEQTVAVTSGAQSVTFTNVNGSPVTLGQAGLSGANASDFALNSDACSGSTIPAGGTCAIGVTFTPATTGSRFATLTLNTNPVTFPLMVYLSGEGTPLSGSLMVSPSTINFPDTAAMTASAPQTVTVSNVGAFPFSVSVSAYSSAFTVVNKCLSPIAAGGSCTVQVTFRPLSVQNWSSQLNVIDASSSLSGSVALSGNGIAAAAATLCPTAVSFGNQDVEVASTPSTVSLNNTGSGNLTVTQIAISGDFTQTNTCGGSAASLPTMTACTINVTFKPSGSGVRNGTLTITDNAAGSPHHVSLTGTGVASSGALLPILAPWATLSLGPGAPAAVPSAGGPREHARELAKQAYEQLPLSFEANLGQSDPTAKFLARGPGFKLFLTGDEAVLTLKKPSVVSGQSSVVSGQSSVGKTKKPGDKSQDPGGDIGPGTKDNGPGTTDTIFRMKLVGANANAAVAGAQALPGRSNYFIGNDPGKWRTNVPNYAQAKYQDIYPGIDLVYYGNQGGQLEYDFVVAPGADPAAIRLALSGEVGSRQSAVGSGVESRRAPQSKIQNLKSRIDADGDLVVETDNGDIRFHKPVVYQEKSTVDSSQLTVQGKRRNSADNPKSKIQNRKFLEGRYILTASNQVRFALGPYDHTRPLVIDPALTYSTYLGGSGEDSAAAIALDSAGEAYVVGWTESANFPTANPFQPSLNQTQPYADDAFITKLSADGSSFVFSTFFGGSDNDAASAITVDSAGNAYITGNTLSTDFPITTGAFQTTVKNSNTPYPDHGFVTKLSADGSTLLYSTYLSGSGEDLPYGIGIDATGNAYVTGGTTSPDFPTTPAAAQKTFTASTGVCGLLFCGSGFVTALNAKGSALVYSTFLSGSGFDSPQAIAVDAAGNAYVAGLSTSLDFPTTTGSLQTGSGSPSEGFAAKYNAKGQVVYSTYVSGVIPTAIAIDSQGAVYLAGQGMPGSNPALKSAQFGPTPPNASFGAVAKLHPAGCTLVYSDFLGGMWGAWGNAIAVDSAGEAFVAGYTFSPDFPTVNALQSTCPACNSAEPSGVPIISKIDPTGTTLVYSTFVGGGESPANLCCSKATGIALDSAGNAYITGQTLASDFPTAHAVQPHYGGGQTDSFIAKVSPTIVPSLFISPTDLTFTTQEVGTTSPPQTVTLTNQEAKSITIKSIADDDPDFPFTTTCGTTLGAGASCTITVKYSPSASGSPDTVLEIGDNAVGGPHVIGLEGTSIGAPQLYLGGSSVDVEPAPLGQTSGATPVAVENLGQSPLIITHVAVTGVFTQTNNCGTLAFTASCTINISFTPALPGDNTGTLTITDNAPGSPQTFPIVGDGQDFTLGASPTSNTVTPGQSVQYTITVTPEYEFPGQVALNCSGAPAAASCSVTPASPITNNGVNSATATLRVGTTVGSLLPPARRSPPVNLWPRLLLALLGVLILLACTATSARQRRVLVPLAAAVLLLALLASCGGGSGGGGGGGGSTPGTQPGTYTLTVTGTSGSLTHSTTVTLTVN